jgi:hypothetical protein
MPRATTPSEIRAIIAANAAAAQEQADHHARLRAKHFEDQKQAALLIAHEHRGGAPVEV